MRYSYFDEHIFDTYYGHWSLLLAHQISVAMTIMMPQDALEQELKQGANHIFTVKLGILIFDEPISETKAGLCRQLIVYKRDKDRHDVKRIY